MFFGSASEFLRVAMISARRVRRVRVVCQPLPRVGIGTPNIRVDRFLRLAVRLRLVFFARFLAI